MTDWDFLTTDLSYTLLWLRWRPGVSMESQLLNFFIHMPKSAKGCGTFVIWLKQSVMDQLSIPIRIA